jgi:ribosomal protein S18 acetylase RimI-like enzyme
VNRPGVTIRRATEADRDFLTAMLSVAASWRPGALTLSTISVRSEPALARYVVDWPREREVGVIAESRGERIGAAWWRWFSEDEPGYGFVGAAVPELSIGVVPVRRGRGVGTALLRRLIELARDAQLPGLSLSVESDNPATQLYERLGFRTVATGDGARTMLLDLAERGRGL